MDDFEDEFGSPEYGSPGVDLTPIRTVSFRLDNPQMSKNETTPLKSAPHDSSPTAESSVTLVFSPPRDMDPSTPRPTKFEAHQQLPKSEVTRVTRVSRAAITPTRVDRVLRSKSVEAIMGSNATAHMHPSLEYAMAEQKSDLVAGNHALPLVNGLDQTLVSTGSCVAADLVSSPGCGIAQNPHSTLIFSNFPEKSAPGGCNDNPTQVLKNPNKSTDSTTNETQISVQDPSKRADSSVELRDAPTDSLKSRLTTMGNSHTDEDESVQFIKEELFENDFASMNATMASTRPLRSSTVSKQSRLRPQDVKNSHVTSPSLQPRLSRSVKPIVGFQPKLEVGLNFDDLFASRSLFVPDLVGASDLSAKHPAVLAQPSSSAVSKKVPSLLPGFGSSPVTSFTRFGSASNDSIRTNEHERLPPEQQGDQMDQLSQEDFISEFSSDKGSAPISHFEGRDIPKQSVDLDALQGLARTTGFHPLVGLGICSDLETAVSKQTSKPIQDDSDDDCKIIDQKSASGDAQKKWHNTAHNSKGTNRQAQGQFKVKSEPESDAPHPELPALPDQCNITNLEAGKTATVAEPKSRSKCSIVARQLQQLGCIPALATVISSKKRSREDCPSSKSNNLDSSMDYEDDNDIWMQDESGLDREMETLEKDFLLLSKKKLPLDTEDAARLLKITNRIQVKKRMQSSHEHSYDLNGDPNIGDEDPEYMFVSDQPHNHRRSPGLDSSRGNEITPEEVQFDAMLQGGLAHDHEDSPNEQRKTSSKTPRKKPAKDAREVADQKREKELKKKLKKRKESPSKVSNAKSASKEKGKAKGKGEAKDKSHKSKSGKGKVKTDRKFRNTTGNLSRSRVDECNRQILDGLISSDPIQDRISNPVFKLGLAPEITGGTKSNQLQQLFANLPSESDVSQGRRDKRDLLDASKGFGHGRVKAVKGKWLIKGMTSTLYHHQLLGTHWMVSRELSSVAPFGGLLADGMGLGKTIETLACMVGHPPSINDKKRGIVATLIVVPSSVISQWKDEIGAHTDKMTLNKIIVYKGNMDISLDMLSSADVVLTSYHEVMRQFPFPDKKGEEASQSNGETASSDDLKKYPGPLHLVHWRRVVLDEAHAIKNYSSRTSQSCQGLHSVYRWCLTGTPLLNRVEELFPYFCFLQATQAGTWASFKKFFCDSNEEECQKRVNVLLSYSMMRRTMKTTVLGRPIITLPEPHPHLEFISFSREEQLIYRITENRIRTKLNVFFAAGTADRSFSVFMVQLLRLRQCTSHPFMLERTIRESWTPEDVEELSTGLKSLPNAEPFYHQCEMWVRQTEQDKKDAAARGEAYENNDNDPSFGVSKFGHSFGFEKALDTLKKAEKSDQASCVYEKASDTLRKAEEYDQVTCRICSDVPIDAVITTPCKHVFCGTCLDDYLSHRRSVYTDEQAKICPYCKMAFGSFEEFTALAIEDDDNIEVGQYSEADEEGPMPHDTPSAKRRKRSGSSQKTKSAVTAATNNLPSKGLDALNFEPATMGNASSWVTKSDHDDNFPLVPSAKTTALKATLLAGFNEAPTDKVVIYTQFRTLARIIGRMCKQEDWGFLYLTGDASLAHRSKVIKMFREDESIMILIAGLKCGGVGLNFPFANRCISLDLWWNHAVEQQAFGRIFRIGQKKETYMTRIVVRNSVDQRLLNMQMHKMAMVDQAMQDGVDPEERRRQHASLTLGQISNLFGFLRTDDDDNVVRVEQDYDDVDPRQGEGTEMRAGDGREGQAMDLTSG